MAAPVQQPAPVAAPVKPAQVAPPVQSPSKPG